jgi:quercetin 2,3-dioxygenase
VLTVRRASERFPTKIQWLDSKHTFSFGEHYDPRHMGFRSLRVINEDKVLAASGFPTHGHKDMEILSWVLDGELKHEDSIGTGSVIRPGDLQRMTAGTGVRHSEWNPSEKNPVHFLQIWILPEKPNLVASYEQKAFDEPSLKNTLRLVASRDGRDGSVTVHQDAALYVARLEPGATVGYEVAKGRGAWAHVARGSAALDDVSLSAGDGASTESPGKLSLTGGKGGAEVLLFDLR